jgi:hypothetical protein
MEIARAILSKKNNVGGITIPNLKLYYRIMLTKTVLYFQKTDRKTNEIEWKTQK